jgi:DNA repair protein RadD
MIQIAMVQTLTRRLDRLKGVRFLIIDECHHAVAATWRRIIDAAPGACVLRVTATPERLDGQGHDEIFEALVVGPQVKPLIAAGYLSPYVVFAPEKQISLKGVRTSMGDYAPIDLAQLMNTSIAHADALREYRKHADGQRAICFCAGVKHSREIAQFLCDSGLKAVHLDGDTPSGERRQSIAALASGEIQILANCGLISEGFGCSRGFLPDPKPADQVTGNQFAADRPRFPPGTRQGSHGHSRPCRKLFPSRPARP